jgi:hypothetical protein
MGDLDQVTSGKAKAPWHLWLVGIVSLLWYLSGATTILWAQYGSLSRLSADEVAYYAAKPLLLQVLAIAALVGGVGGAVGLLMRRKWALALLAILVIGVMAQNVIELANGTSRALANNGAMIATVFIALIAVLTWLYARVMVRKGVLT